MSDLESRLRAALHDETAELAAPPSLADDMVTRGTRIRRRRRVVGGAAGLLVLAAVVPVWKSIDTSSGGPLPPAVSPTPSVITQAPPTRSTPTSPTTQNVAPWSTEPVDIKHHVVGEPRIVNLRVGRHGTYDRVVVDLDGPIRSYHVGYVRQFVTPQGTPIQLPGAAILALHLGGATHDNRGNSVYRGNPQETYAFPSVLASTLIDFEGVDFGLGIAERSPFRVFELSSPTRIVIDIHH